MYKVYQKVFASCAISSNVTHDEGVGSRIRDAAAKSEKIVITVQSRHIVWVESLIRASSAL